jgi:hypothetical protein
VYAGVNPLVGCALEKWQSIPGRSATRNRLLKPLFSRTPKNALEDTYIRAT